MMDATLADCPLWTAQYYARHAADCLIRAEMLKRLGRSPDTYEKMGADNLKEAARALGFELVKFDAIKVGEAA